ncbi:MAG: RnfABCDGE type electron transport complex subunit D [Acutalibacteraceae bacterium]|nr:RnfABCDGE type electron transport complex subunit D [Acutalibacteraceae bacterium]
MDKLILSVSPHLRGRTTTTGIMLDVVIALIPALIASVLIFGIRALVLTAVCVATCVLAEYLFGLICKKPATIGDLSAVVTGMLLAFNLPLTLPIWQAVIGSIVAIVVVKQLFGGIGMNFANPAIVGRIFMFIAFSGTMSNYVMPADGALFKFNLAETDLISGATPLVVEGTDAPGLLTLLLGQNNGVIGETCALALIIGGIYLVVRKVITIHIPVVFIATVFVLSFITAFAGGNGFMVAVNEATYQILAGGLMLGAIFMATDYVTSPCTKWGKVIFALGCGIITFAIRQWGSYPEGVSFSILFMNILTPYINNWTATKPLGGAKA